MSARDELLALARRHMWAAWQLSSEELASQAAVTLLGLGMLVPEGGAQELEKLRASRWDATEVTAGLESRLHAMHAELTQARKQVAESKAQREALAERLRAGQQWQRGRNPELVSEDFVSQSELRSIFGIPLAPPWADGITKRIAPTQALREETSAEQSVGAYPPALPWAQLMDHEDLTDFLDELAASAITHVTSEVALTEVESTIAQWRLIAEAQHAHNTAPGPDAQELRSCCAGPVCTCTPSSPQDNEYIPPREKDVTPQVTKLRALLAGQRQQTGETR